MSCTCGRAPRLTSMQLTVNVDTPSPTADEVAGLQDLGEGVSLGDLSGVTITAEDLQHLQDVGAIAYIDEALEGVGL